MLFVRIVGFLTVIAVGVGILAYLLSGERRFLRLAGRIAIYALGFVLLVMVLMALERIIVL
jgi:hypothetical protein